MKKYESESDIPAIADFVSSLISSLKSGISVSCKIDNITYNFQRIDDEENNSRDKNREKVQSWSRRFLNKMKSEREISLHDLELIFDFNVPKVRKTVCQTYGWSEVRKGGGGGRYFITTRNTIYSLVDLQKIIQEKIDNTESTVITSQSILNGYYSEDKKQFHDSIKRGLERMAITINQKKPNKAKYEENDDCSYLHVNPKY